MNKKTKNLTKRETFWAGVSIGKKRERQANMSGTRAPEVQQELDMEDAFEKGYWTGIGQGIRAKIEDVVSHNQASGFGGSNVVFNITYSSGLWYLELSEATGRKVTIAQADLGIALAEIFR